MRRNQTLRARGGQAGFSMLEGLVATALLLFVILGVLPLFTQSMLNNLAGRESTTSTNLGADSLERTLQMPLFTEDLTFASGNALRIYEHLSSGDADGTVIQTVRAEVSEATRPSAADYRTEFSGVAWTTTPEVDDWGRISTVRYFGLAALSDNVLAADEQLPGGTSEVSVHVKEIEVTVLSGLPEAGTLVSSGPINTMRVLKAY
jgi:Tfp pilus assembly protein PilV